MKRTRETDTSNPPLKRRPMVRTTAKAATTSSTAALKRKKMLEELKQRVEDLEEKSTEMQESLTQAKAELKEKSEEYQELLSSAETVASRNFGLETEVSSLKQVCEQASKAQTQIQTLIRSTEEQYTIRLQGQESKYQLLQMTHETLKVQQDMLSQELERVEEIIDDNDQKLEEQKQNIEEIEEKYKESLDLENEREKTIEQQEQEIEEQLRYIAELEQRARDDEMLRRKLHNSIQELKGNIRVFVRVRPLLGEEKNEPFPYEFPDSNKATTIQVNQGVQITTTGNEKESEPIFFDFDKVFNPGATQNHVFQEISALVQSALDGYNVCIFTYGQTGSGKTFTMEGPKKPSPDTQGMIPRAVHQIFEYANSLSDKGWSYELTANYLEIYNETIRDLLCASNKSKKNINYKIQHNDVEQSTNVSNLSYVPVTSSGQVHDLLNRAAKNRATAKTEMNERSSRSHSVFQLRMSGKNSVTGETATGLLNLVDLAGSERLKDSKATGDRLRETRNINSSLSTLGKVISALSNKGKSIPYRESKLTWLLRFSLGGNSKTLMFVNISPSPSNIKESINSLRFAKEVNSCNIGTARKAGTRNVK